MFAYVGSRRGGDTGRGELARDGPAAGDGGEASVGPAHAQGVGAVVQTDVADVARPAVDAPVDLAPDDDTGADPRGRLDQDEGAAVRVTGPLLRQGHQIGVVVDEHGQGSGGRHRADVLGPGLAESFPYGEAVPAGHDRRLHDPRRLPVHRARHRETDAADPLGPRPGLGEQRAEPAGQLVQGAVGAVGDDEGAGVFGEDGAGEVERGDAGVPGLQVGDEHHGVRGVELQPGGRASAGGGAADVAQPARSEELVEPVSHRGAGEPRRLLELAARGGLAAANELQQMPRAGLVSCHPRRPRPVRRVTARPEGLPGLSSPALPAPGVSSCPHRWSGPR